MAQVVPYRVRPGDPSGMKHPWLIVYLDDDPIPEWFIVDSGSSHSFIPTHVASRIGLAFDQGQGQEGRAIGRFQYVRARDPVKGRTEFGEAFVLDRPAVSTYLPFGLLGRSDFFDAFVITFDQRNLRMEIERQRGVLGFRPN